MMDSLILYYNKEKMQEFMPIFEKLAGEIDCKKTSTYFKIPSRLRIKEVHTEIEREFNSLLANIHYENPDKIAIFAFKM